MRRGATTLYDNQAALVLRVTISFFIVGLCLAALMAHVVETMVTSADQIDDRRATQAVSSAIEAVQDRLSATLHDNSVWDEAYEAALGPNAERWAFENWGLTKAPYLLYDGCIVADRTGTVYLAAYHNTRFDPKDIIGPAYERLLHQAASGETAVDPVLLKHKGRLFVVGANAIRPFSDRPTQGPYPVLMLLLELTPQRLVDMGGEQGVHDLRWDVDPSREALSLALRNPDGAVVARLAWQPRHPGRILYERVRPFLLAAGTLLVLLFAAILVFGSLAVQRLQKAAEASRFEATHDALSGLLNRKGLLERLARPAARGADRGSRTLLLVDLDGFKAVNDAWGHAVGDALIVRVGAALAAAHPDILAAARLGGDEFALLHAGPVDTALIETLHALFRRPFMIDDREVEVGASIGAATGESGMEASELLRRADLALYRAKETGRNRAVLYDAALERDRHREATLEGALRRAIATGAVTLDFQPLVRAADGRMTGVEALARWNGPDGPVSPNIFIPLAEKAGLIEALGRHLLRLAIDEARRWPAIGLSVNLSPLQLCLPDFAGMVAALLETKGFDPHRLTFEVTETVFIANAEQARQTIAALRAIGVRFALDDFGCGYASIGALRRFGFDRIKLDRSLVAALDAEASGAEVLDATIRLAGALNLPVTAEGIETPAQADSLRLAGCEQLQGYFLGRPVSASEIDAFLADGAGFSSAERLAWG